MRATFANKFRSEFEPPPPNVNKFLGIPFLFPTFYNNRREQKFTPPLLPLPCVCVVCEVPYLSQL